MAYLVGTNEVDYGLNVSELWLTSDDQLTSEIDNAARHLFEPAMRKADEMGDNFFVTKIFDFDGDAADSMSERIVAFHDSEMTGIARRLDLDLDTGQHRPLKTSAPASHDKSSKTSSPAQSAPSQKPSLANPNKGPLVDYRERFDDLLTSMKSNGLPVPVGDALSNLFDMILNRSLVIRPRLLKVDRENKRITFGVMVSMDFSADSTGMLFEGTDSAIDILAQNFAEDTSSGLLGIFAQIGDPEKKAKRKARRKTRRKARRKARRSRRRAR